MLIEQRMNSAMGSLLSNEALHFGFVFGLFCFGQDFKTIANRVDEKLLSHRKAH